MWRLLWNWSISNAVAICISFTSILLKTDRDIYTFNIHFSHLNPASFSQDISGQGKLCQEHGASQNSIGFTTIFYSKFGFICPTWKTNRIKQTCNTACEKWSSYPLQCKSVKLDLFTHFKVNRRTLWADHFKHSAVLHRVQSHTEHTLRVFSVLWCLQKPHKGRPEMSAHTGKEGRDEPKELLLHKVLEQLLVLRNPFHVESGGAVPCAGPCMNPAVLTLTEQSVLDNTSIILHPGMWHRAPLLWPLLCCSAVNICCSPRHGHWHLWVINILWKAQCEGAKPFLFQLLWTRREVRSLIHSWKSQKEHRSPSVKVKQDTWFLWALLMPFLRLKSRK